ncbi:MAG: ABC transporter permease, partial [Lachnospiraceae bacterium]|nr:ABC transporter permease [Lachnospiraceae bacterium]
MNTLIHLLEAAVIAGTPLLLGALGEILCERAGNLNLGVEGEMFMGAVAGIAAAFFYNRAGGENGFVAVAFATLFSFLFGALGALIYAFLVVTMRANQNVPGLILTIFGTGFG